MASKSRAGVILAAGLGSRLQGVSDETLLKPLTPVGGRPLILRTIDSLSKAGCSSVVVVVGHGAADVETAVSRAYSGDLPLRFAINPLYRLQNGLSVLAARPFIDGEFVITMADHVFGDGVMELAAAHSPPEGGATLLVDYKLDTIFDMDDATKVDAIDGRISRIGKQIEHYNCVDTGMFVCTEGLMTAIDDVYQSKGDASLSDGVMELAAKGLMHVLDVQDGFWQDVDTPAMLEHANRMLS
ncbi:MAG TPA: NTP transferase domain-containing protein [Rhodothermales bacterium]|nr:NTP transferase domain-containing protein [Rhodothermales bacterium]